MNHRLIAILIIAISITFLFFIGFGLLSETGQAPSPIPLNDVMSLYETALNNISKKDQITISVTTETNTTLLSNSFGDSSTKMITYQNLHTDFPTVQINEQRISGSQEISIHEVYSNGTAYQTINSAKFKYNLAAEHYLDRQIPPVLLDPSLYTNISGYKIANQYQINFEDGLQAENWFFTPNAEFVNANGNVTIDSDGNLNSSTYTLTYRNSGAMISVHYVVEIIGETDTIIVMPDPTQSYIEIPSADSIINLEHAANFLIQSEAISSKYTDDIYFEAFGDRRTQNITINAVTDDSWDVNVETITTLTNDSRIEQITEHSKVETFSNNRYTSSTDGGSLIVNDQIDKALSLIHI